MNNTNDYKQRRARDIERGLILEKLMDSIYASNNMLVCRINDITMQKKGVDLVWSDNGLQRYIDEKFALNYWNTDLQTFAFELSSNNNFEKQGWFTHNESLTTDYLLLWIRSNDENFNSIIQGEALLIEKESINEFLKTSNIDISTIISRFHKEGRYTNNSKRLVVGGGIKVVQSHQFEKEQPINLIIPRSTLRVLAHKQMKITSQHK